MTSGRGHGEGLRHSLVELEESTSMSSCSALAENVSGDSSDRERTPLLQESQRLFRSLSGVTDDVPVSSSGGPRRQLSTFSGVFCPVVLSMFSVLLFLRVGFIVGQAGVLEVLLQFALSYGILGVTVLAICAISTNGAIEGGGCYYMISRALGPEFGGSVGTIFFFANEFACALYITGCVESVIDNFGPGGNLVADLVEDGRWWAFLYGSIMLLLACLVCLIGAALFARTSAAILLVVMVATISIIVSIFVKNDVLAVAIPRSNSLVYYNDSVPTQYANYTGLNSETFLGNLYSNYSEDYTTETTANFAIVFAVAFSGVTGIMAGANMSGDLKSPSKSIPKGTILACCFTCLVYVIITAMVAASSTNYLLLNNYNFLQKTNIWGPLVMIGVFAATFSAALSNLIGASRVLQAVARDNIFGPLLSVATKTTKSGNPWFAVLISWLLVQVILVIGSLNEIAQITSEFFLLSYAADNLACLALEMASAPNFRPTFKYFSWHTCIVGIVGNLVMMFLINAVYASAAIIFCMLLIIILLYMAPPASWGSISQALLFHQVRKYLLLLDSRKDHVKFWRPQMLLLVANPRSSCELINFINDLKKSGLYVIGNVKVQSDMDIVEETLQEEYPFWLGLIDYLKVKAFIELTCAQSIREGVQQLMRVSGLGALKPNTVIFGFYDSSAQQDSFSKEFVFRKHASGVLAKDEVMKKFGDLRHETNKKMLSASDYVLMLQDAVRMNKNFCLARNFSALDKKLFFSSQKRRVFIDVWPINFVRPELSDVYDTTSLFCLQLACILNMTQEWKSRSVLRVFLPVQVNSENLHRKQRKLQELLKELRIKARIEVVAWDEVTAMFQNPEPEDEQGPDDVLWHLSKEYLRSLNALMGRDTHDTAVVFCSLPAPPRNPQLHTSYLKCVDCLTADLPPTLLVHGVSIVTSTTL